MMKKNFFVILVVLLFMGCFTVLGFGQKESESNTDSAGNSSKADVTYPPKGWVTDIREAYRIAQKENKMIFVDFTGSDWCVWCKRLDAEVFSESEFKEYAEKNLVLLFVDSPSGIELSSEQIRHNQLLAQILGVKGYPTIWLFGSDLSPLLSTGYQRGGAAEYIRHLEEDRPSISKEQSDDFKASFKKAIEDNLGKLE
ncbi:MAG: thioredoxin family protein [Spirochaetales bacterium]|nr:thioredoxin family protein [Spirochaetales bacterium]